MKVIIIEGSPEELADYEARTGVIGRTHTEASAIEHAEEPLAAGNGEAIGGKGVAAFRSFISGRAREPEIAAHVEDYIRRVLDLETTVKIGTSKKSKDGHGDYLRVYDSPSSWYGAVAYANARNADLALRLTRDDVADVTDPHVKFARVQPSSQYQVKCPVTTPEAIDLAVKLTQRALDKVRRPRPAD